MGKGIEPLGAVKIGFKILASRVASGEASAALRWLQVFRSFSALKPKLFVGLKPHIKPP